MNVREKLVELLKTNACPSTFMCDPACRYIGFEDCFPERFADHLIAHGVTVQEWISVEDKLPEVVSIHKGYRSTVNITIIKNQDGKFQERLMKLHIGSIYPSRRKENDYGKV